MAGLEKCEMDPQPAEAAWRIGILDKVLDVLKNAATRAARRAPEDLRSVRQLHRGNGIHNQLKQLGALESWTKCLTC